MKRILMILPVFLVLALGFSHPMLAKEKGVDSVDHLFSGSTQQTVTNRTLVNVGQVAMWIYSTGRSSITPAGNSGLIFPRGSSPVTGAIFEDGPIWGGLVNDGSEPVLRVGGGTYSEGTVAGAIVRRGVAEDKNDQQNVDRIWRIRRDFLDANLRQDAAEFNSISASSVTDAQIKQLRDIYRQDWIDWPVHKGAPFYDADGDGAYNPAFNADGSPKLAPQGEEVYDPAVHADEPGVADADQVVWLVSNDLDPQAVQTLYGSPSIGMEVQTTLWAYARSDALGQIVFKQFRFIYKGTATTPENATIDSLHFCQWSDPDLGSFGDDFAASDVGLSLVYAYNSSSNDATYSAAGLPPPASGYDFFAGPLVPDPEGEAIFGLEKRAGFRNLPMTTAGFFAAGGQDSDPTRGGDYNGTLQWWNLLRGFRPRPETPATPWINPLTGEVTKFVLTGDPVAGTGWIDSNPGDRRILAASGPFTMAVGDTQETVIAVMASLGSDRLSSVAVLKFTDRFAQEAFDNLFELPKAPPKPIVSASEFDGKILLNWGFNPGGVVATEQTVDKGYAFEGYNVYQLPSAGASLNQATLLATFDVINEVTVISQEQFDEASGLVLNLPVQQGTNSGISRTLTVSTDAIRELDLINGQSYFFGVTAYNFNGALTVKSLESTPTIVTVVPQTTKPGVRFQAAIGDTVPAVDHVNLAGGALSDGRVVPVVVDPSAITGDSYEVGFQDVVVDNSDPEHPVTEIGWYLFNTSSGDTILQNQFNQSGDADYLITEGLQVKVLGAPSEIATAPGSEADGMVEVMADGVPLTEDNFDGAGTPFGGNKVWHSLNAGGFSDRYYVSAGGGVGQLARLARSIADAVPFDFEMRFTTPEEGSLGWWAFTSGTAEPVPFTLWRIGIGTVDDPSDDVRLIPIHFSGGTDDAWDISYTDGAFGFICSDWTYYYFDSRGYDAYAADAADGVVDDGTFGEVEYIARMIICDFDGNGAVAGPGYVIRIFTTKPNSLDDKFTFSTGSVAATSSPTQAKEDVLNLVNVYPNPYLGINTFEPTQFNRFMTFSHLPEKATIRIFNLAGILVRTLEKTDASQFVTWDLQNENKLPVAGGIYIAHIEMPGLGTKDLKLAIIQEQQFLRRF